VNVLIAVADVGDDPVVRGRGGAEDGDVGRQAREHVPDAPVVRAEVVPPVRDAVRLVHDEQADPLDDLRARPPIHTPHTAPTKVKPWSAVHQGALQSHHWCAVDD